MVSYLKLTVTTKQIHHGNIELFNNQIDFARRSIICEVMLYHAIRMSMSCQSLNHLAQ